MNFVSIKNYLLLRLRIRCKIYRTALFLILGAVTAVVYLRDLPKKWAALDVRIRNLHTVIVLCFAVSNLVDISRAWNLNLEVMRDGGDALLRHINHQHVHRR